MTFTVAERFVLLGVTSAAQGDVTTLRILRQLREELSFDETEHRKLKFVQEGSQVRWQSNVQSDKEIAIGDKAKAIIVQQFVTLEKQKQLGLNQLDLYERFCGNGEG